jgi:hypothetical protein
MAVMPRAIPTAIRRVVVCALSIFALLPAAAEAKIIELGQTDQQPVPSCPAKPCLAVSRTTGYQAKVGTDRGLFVAPEPGRVVAWSITLGAPSAKQIKFFNTTLGGAPSAGITVFKPAEHLYGTITGQSPVEALTPYLGETVQFPLEKSLPVKKGSTVALTVPTWAPALAIGFGTDTSWRASRTKKQCDDTSTQTAISTLGTVTRFLCLYKTARLTYSVTLVTNPHGPKKKAKKKKTATPTPTATPKPKAKATPTPTAAD